MFISPSGFRTWLFCVLAGVLAGGCGGGGGGSSPASGQALTAAYYPSANLDTWAYDGTSSSASKPFFDTISVTGTRSVLGTTTSVFLEDNPEGSGVPLEQYYVANSRAFTFFGNNDPTDLLDAAIVPADEMVFGVPLNSHSLFNKSGLDVGQDLDSDGRNEKFDTRATATFEKFESLVTTAGTFSSAAKFTQTATVTIHYSHGGTATGTSTSTQWRIPDVGLIKEIDSSSLNGTTSLDTLDIRGYRLNGVGVGYLAPQTLASGIAYAISDETQPGRSAIGSDGTNFLLASRQQTNIPNVSALSKWTARLVLADGTAQSPFDLGPVDANWGSEAAIAFDGSNYMVLTDTTTGTSGASGIVAQRVSPTGNLIDAAPGIPVASSAINPAIAFGNGAFLVAYVTPTVRTNVFARFIQTSGSVGSEFTIHTGTGIQGFPSVAFDGTNFLVAWERHDSDIAPETADIFGVRVTPLGTTPSGIFSISTAPEAQNFPQVSCEVTTCFVIWTDRRNFPGVTYNTVPGPGDMYGSRISSFDALLDGPTSTGGLAIATGVTANSGYPALTFTGTEYIVAWSRGAFVNNPGGATGIYAARVGTNGSINLGPASTGVAISGPPVSASRMFFVSLTSSLNGTLVTWLNNTELSGTTKSISGALVYPLANQ